jgi:hypothetical protein
MFSRKLKRVSPLLIIGLALALAIAWSHLPKPAEAQSSSNALTVQVATSQGFARPGNALPANFLVVVSDSAGAPAADLDQSDFFISNQFALPGQICGFSGNIVSFVNVGAGVYRIQVDLIAVPLCVWVEGDYLANVSVSDGARFGQSPTTLSIHCTRPCPRAVATREEE